MVRNDQRRETLADAGLEVLAELGARGLTHRAVDRAAGVPSGTTSNYFSSRIALLAALAERIYARLEPAPDVVIRKKGEAASVELFTRYVADIVRRITEAPQLTIALLELRLEATRNDELADSLAQTLQRGFRADVDYHSASGLPGGEDEVALLHYAINGLMLDVLTPSIGAQLHCDDAVKLLVERLVPPVKMRRSSSGS